VGAYSTNPKHLTEQPKPYNNIPGLFTTYQNQSFFKYC